MKIVMLKNGSYSSTAIVELEGQEIAQILRYGPARERGDLTPGQLEEAWKVFLGVYEKAMSIANGDLSVAKFCASFAADLQKTVEAQLALTAGLDKAGEEKPQTGGAP